MSNDDDIVEIERVGGFAGMGSASSRIRSRGVLQGRQLTKTDRAWLERQIAPAKKAATPRSAAKTADEFRYRLKLTRGKTAHPVIEVAESELPEAFRRCVKDELL